MVETMTGAGESATTNRWELLGLASGLAQHLQTIGYDEPTALQTVLIPAVFNETDVIMEAPAGTGRTAAIGAVLAELVGDCDPGDSAVALVITSSDHRCSAISSAVQKCGEGIHRSGESGVRYGVVSDLGPIEAQGKALAQPIDVVIGTPQRLNQLAAAEKLDLGTLEMVIVDQADDISIGDHREALTSLLDSIEADRQRVVLAGANLPPLLEMLSDRVHNPARPTLPIDEARRNAIRQRAFAVSHAHPETIARLARSLGSTNVLTIVTDAEAEEFISYFARTGLPISVATWSRMPELGEGTTLICTSLPTWTDRYATVLDAATAAGCEELILLAAPANRQLMRALGRVGGVRLNAAPLPTDDGVTTRQVERTAELVADHLERIAAQPTPRFLSAVHRLAADHDVADVAAAAMELAHQALQREIEPGSDTPLLFQQGSERPSVGDRRKASSPPVESSQRRKGGDRRSKETEEGMTRLFVAAGYNFGVRPGDIVGAFAGESGLSGKEIGNIDIRESFTLVEVPENLADDVITAMETGTIKGRQIEVRRERY